MAHSQRAVLLDSEGVRLHQAEVAGVFGAEEEIQVGILAEIPVRPSMRPVWPSEITSVISEDFHGAQLARLITRVKNELSPAFRPDGGLLLFWFLPVHFAAGLARR